MNLLNLIQWGEVNNFDPLFNDIVLPNGIDKNTLVDKIVYDNWDLEPRVTDYNLMKTMIDNFFKVKLDAYTKIYNALNSEYNPIHNFDRHEDLDENRKTTTSDNNTRNNTTTRNDTTSDSGSTTEDNNAEHKTSAYNSSSYQPSTNDTSNTKTTSNNTNTLKGNTTENGTDNRDVTSNDTYKTNNHLYGNIGVTTTQQMIESEIEMRENNNIYVMISLDFRKEFMLLCL